MNATLAALAIAKMNVQPKPETLSTESATTLHEPTFSDSRAETASLPASQEVSEEKLDSKEPPSEVNWDGDSDPENPRNWRKSKKWYVTLTVSLAILAANFGTSIISPGLQDIAQDFGVSIEVAILALSLYLIGFATGPLFAAPLSEEYGRNKLYIPFMAVYIILQIGVARVQNIGGFLVLRFLSGVAASPPATLGAGTITDVWNPGFEQVVGVSVFLISPFAGPVLGPIVGGYVTETIGWRWTIWILMIFSGCIWPLQVLAPETYGPYILYKKAKRLQKAGHNVLPPKFRPFRKVLATALKRPPRMLFTEAFVFLISLYASFLFGLLFFFFLAFPLVFGPIYGFGLGSRGLAFIGIGLGTVTGNIGFILLFRWFHKKKAFSDVMKAFLGPAMIGSVMLPISLFWFGWTARPGVHWIVPIIAGFPFGCSMMLLFVGTSVYLSSTYRQYAASAFAVNSWMRYTFAAAFPLFARQMIDSIGVGFSMTVMGCFAVLLVPIPFLFYRYGDAIRARSPYLNPKSDRPIV